MGSQDETKAVVTVSLNDELSRVWKKVEEKVIKMAEGTGEVVRPGLDIAGVLLCLDTVQKNNSKATEKYAAAKSVFNRTLQGISTIGGIVADGASNVFAPATTCYNALTFVITAWQNYEGIFDSLAALLENCSEFFDRLTEYARTNMNNALTKVACQYLELFVSICDQSIHLRKKRHKFAAFMKTLFLSDDGMKDLLDQMRKLGEKELNLVMSQTYRVANDAASRIVRVDGQVGVLVEGQVQEKKEKEKVKWKETVAKALGFDVSIAKSDSTEDWENAFNRHKKALLEGSGEWLSDNPLFTSWAGRSDTARSILGLEGNDGAGKTTTTCNIIMRLKRLNRNNLSSGARSVVAYYFLEKDSKATSDDHEVASKVSRSLIWQLATADDPYMKSIASICERMGTFNHYHEMWEELLLNNPDRANMNSTFFIVIDGLTSNASKLVPLLQSLSSMLHTTHRDCVLLTGSKSTFDMLESDGVRIDRIALGTVNRSDIELYVNTRMDDMDVLKDIKRPGIPAIREKILSRLAGMPDGDYYKVGRVLDDIKQTDEAEEIESLLEMADSTRPEQILAEIEKLNKASTPKEISEINEIIIWVNAARAWMTCPQMEAVLALRAGAASIGTSLLSLEAKIKTKYTLFIVDEFNEVSYKIEEAKNHIPLKRAQEVVEKDSKDIQPSEVTLVKYYMKTVCPPEVYDKFGFDAFFDLKMVRQTNRICQDPDNEDIIIALRCLTCLVEPRNVKTEDLIEYSADSLLDHLNRTDLSLADRDIRSQIGLLLVRLFTEEYAVTSLFWSSTLDETATWAKTGSKKLFRASYSYPFSWTDWLLSSNGISTVSKFFGDSAVTEGIANESLVKNFKSKEEDRHVVLFEFMAKKAATELFRQESDKYDTLHNFVLLLGYLTKTRTIRKSPPETLETLLKATTLETVQLVEGFAAKALEIEDRDVLWESQKAALLYYMLQKDASIEKNEVETQSRKVLDLNPDDHRTVFTLASVVESSDEAIALLEQNIDKVVDNEDWIKQGDHKRMLAEMMVELGDKLWEIEGRMERAIETYSKALDFDTSISMLYRFIHILSQFDDRKKYGAVMSAIEKLTNTGLADAEAKPIAQEIISLCERNDEFMGILIRAFRAEKRWDLADTIYRKTIETTTTNYWMQNHARLQRGLMLDARGEEYALEAIAMWEDILLLKAPENIGGGMRPYVIAELPKYLVPAYMKQAKLRASEPFAVAEYYSRVDNLQKEFTTATQQLTNKDAVGKSNFAFARSYFQRGNVLAAKHLLRSSVIEDLEMLSDDNIENDTASFYDVMVIFSIMEDMSNALVAWEMTAQSLQSVQDVYLEKKKAWDDKQAIRLSSVTNTDAEQTSESANLATEIVGEKNDLISNSETGADEKQTEVDVTTGPDNGVNEKETKVVETEVEPVRPDPTLVYCDGDCGTRWQIPSEIWVCTETGSVHLTDDCYQRFKAGSLYIADCDKSHKFYFIEKRDPDKYRDIPRGSVLVGDRIVKFEDWKLEVKAAYVDFDKDLDSGTI